MKVLTWFILIPVITGVFYFGLTQGKNNAYWDRLNNELLLCLSIAGREGALTGEGKAYVNQLIDMNVHTYLMSGKSGLRGDSQIMIEHTLFRLLAWKLDNGFEFWSPEPVAEEGSAFEMPAGQAGGSQDFIGDYEVYREKLDVFLDAHLQQIERIRATMGKQDTASQ